MHQLETIITGGVLNYLSINKIPHIIFWKIYIYVQLGDFRLSSIEFILGIYEKDFIGLDCGKLIYFLAIEIELTCEVTFNNHELFSPIELTLWCLMKTF